MKLKSYQHSIVGVFVLCAIAVIGYTAEGSGNWQETGTHNEDNCASVQFEYCSGYCTHYVDWKCEDFGGAECQLGSTMHTPMDSGGCEYFGFGQCICPSGF